MNQLLSLYFFAANVICLANNPSSEVPYNNFYQDTLNFPDSVIVDSICEKVTLCQRLNFVEKNLSIFCRRGGYHQRILGSIAKEGKVQIEIPISNGGSPLSQEQAEVLLLEQINKIKKICLCI